MKNKMQLVRGLESSNLIFYTIEQFTNTGMFAEYFYRPNHNTENHESILIYTAQCSSQNLSWYGVLFNIIIVNNSF